MKRKTRTQVALPDNKYKWFNRELTSKEILEKGGIVSESKVMDIDVYAPCKGFFNIRQPRG